VPAAHVQIAPDSTGKDVDADSVVSTESGTPTVYRQDMVVADPVTYGSKARVFAPGQQRVTMDPTQLFFDSFDTSLDTVNRWATPVASGTGAIAAAWSAGQILLTGGTAANAFSELHSQPSFAPDEPGWLQITFRANIEFPVLTTAYRFWGIGQTTGTPTVAAPLTDAVGWEVSTAGVFSAVTFIGGTRTSIAALTAPGDALAHKYFLFFRGDQSYWAVDNVDSVVASFTTGASGPNVNTLPLKALVISNSGTTATLQVNGVSVGDTARNNLSISDDTYPWRQAAVSAAGALSVAPPPSATATETGVAASASSVTVLAANTARKGAAITNDQASATLYLRLSATAATAASGGYTVILPGGAYYEVPFGYTGQITGIWSAATGFANVSELT
jgi:hypothetical protein